MSTTTINDAIGAGYYEDAAREKHLQQGMTEADKLVTRLAELARAGEMKLVQCGPEDIMAVGAALPDWAVGR
jgi:hypothetical protein